MRDEERLCRLSGPSSSGPSENAAQCEGDEERRGDRCHEADGERGARLGGRSPGGAGPRRRTAPRGGRTPVPRPSPRRSGSGSRSRMPIAASRVAITMKARNVSDRSVLSLTCCSTCSQSTASAGEPLASRIARLAPADIDTAMSWTTIAPSRSTPAAQRRATTTLTSSRATSQMTTSPRGSSAAPWRCTMFVTVSSARSRARTRAHECCGHDQPERRHDTTVETRATDRRAPSACDRPVRSDQV